MRPVFRFYLVIVKGLYFCGSRIFRKRCVSGTVGVWCCVPSHHQICKLAAKLAVTFMFYTLVCVFNSLFSSTYQLFSELFWGIRWYKIIGSNLVQHTVIVVSASDAEHSRLLFHGSIMEAIWIKGTTLHH